MAEGGSGMKGFYWVLGLVGLAGLGAIGWLAMRPKPEGVAANVVITVADTAGFRGYILGSPDAPVEITEYADYQCPACQNFDNVQFPDVRARLIGTGKVRWRYRDFPLPQHPHARLAALSAACADEQGKYWQQHALIYAGQGDWAFKRSAAGMFRDYAKQAGLDLGRYDSCIDTNKYAGRVQASLDEGNKVGVASTPTFLVNGKLYSEVITADRLLALIDSAAVAPAP